MRQWHGIPQFQQTEANRSFPQGVTTGHTSPSLKTQSKLIDFTSMGFRPKNVTQSVLFASAAVDVFESLGLGGLCMLLQLSFNALHWTDWVAVRGMLAW